MNIIRDVLFPADDLWFDFRCWTRIVLLYVINVSLYLKKKVKIIYHSSKPSRCVLSDTVSVVVNGSLHKCGLYELRVNLAYKNFTSLIPVAKIIFRM